jgi:hypothetical protein
MESMGYQAISDNEVAIGKPAGLMLFKKIKNNIEYLYDQIGSAGTGGAIPNGSFEVDSDNNGYPDNWTWGGYNGGTLDLVTVDGGAGSRSVKITHPGGNGNGGGTLESDYLSCAAGDIRSFSLLHWAHDGLRNKVAAHFFDAVKKPLSEGYEQILFDTVYSPPTPERLILPFVPPAGAHFFKVLLYGGVPDEAQAGEVYFDDVCLGDASQTIVPMWGEVTRNMDTKDEYGVFESLNPYLPGGRCSMGFEATKNLSGNKITRYLIMAPGVVPQDWAFVAFNRDILFNSPAKPQEIWYAPLHPCLFNGDDPKKIIHPWDPSPSYQWDHFISLDPQQIAQIKQKQKEDRSRSFGDILLGCKFYGSKLEKTRNVLINGAMTSVTYKYLTNMNLP